MISRFLLCLHVNPYILCFKSVTSLFRLQEFLNDCIYFMQTPYMYLKAMAQRSDFYQYILYKRQKESIKLQVNCCLLFLVSDHIYLKHLFSTCISALHKV